MRFASAKVRRKIGTAKQIGFFFHKMLEKDGWKGAAVR
jgi:hypothetical protein